jgi:DAPG hydrolase PhiG domain
MTEPATTADLLPYLSRPMTSPSEDVQISIEQGPIAVAEALPRTQLDRLLDPAPLTAETGWCTLDDGTGYVAVRTPMPGVTGEMVEWWYTWNPRDPIRYQIWFPGAHDWTHEEEKGGPARAKRHWGVVNYPVEDIGLGMSSLRIEFAPPSQLGFSTDAVNDSRVGTIIAGLVGDVTARLQHTIMIHVFLNAADGLVLRSRFYVGAAIRLYAPKPIAALSASALNRPLFRRHIISSRAPRAMARHCAREYANLATLLPELYRRFHERA